VPEQLHPALFQDCTLNFRYCDAGPLRSLSPEATLDTVLQELSYVLMDTGDSWHMIGMGFYLPRQGMFVRWPPLSLIPTLTGSPQASLADLRAQFYEVLAHTR
jgi:hypothetical protein